MNEREFYLLRRRAEGPTFTKVLAALREDRFDYRPHERSPSAREVAWTLAGETAACCTLIASGRVDWNPEPAPQDAKAILASFARNYEALTASSTAVDDAAWTVPVRLFHGGELLREAPLGEFLWFLLFDAIHHRGQLSTYIRPMGGLVPAIYGPSGDDPDKH